MNSEILVSQQQSNYLERLEACVEAASAIRKIKKEGKEVLLTDEKRKRVCPPPEFQFIGGTDQMVALLDRAVVGIIHELTHPLGKDGEPTNDEDMKMLVHRRIELGKRVEVRVEHPSS